LEGNQKGKVQLLNATIDISEKHSQRIKPRPGKDIWNVLEDLTTSDDFWKLADRFQQKLAPSK
jgi:hypothetical protein